MLRINDVIICKDEDDMIDTMQDLAKSGVDTDFMVDKTQDEYKLIVTEVGQCE